MSSAVVLLSAGLDSTVNLAKAAREMKVRLALTFDYGQRAAARELSKAAEIAALYNVPHKTVKLDWLKDITTTSLVNKSETIPTAGDVSIDDFAVSTQTAKAVWVPNRNGAFLNIAASFAEALKADVVIPGFNKEEATTFADNSQDYLTALNHSFSFSTLSQVKVKCFTTHLDKTEIVRLGVELGAPFHLMWPCYFAEEKRCGKCESCQRFSRALDAAGIVVGVDHL